MRVNAMFDELSARIVKAADRKELERVWLDVNIAYRSVKINVEERNNLVTLKNMAKQRLGSEQAREPGED